MPPQPKEETKVQEVIKETPSPVKAAVVEQVVAAEVPKVVVVPVDPFIENQKLQEELERVKKMNDELVETHKRLEV